MPTSPASRAEHRRTAARLRELDAELAPWLAEVAAARAALQVRTGDDVTLDERRAAHRRLRLAYLDADAVLRTATRAAKARSRYEWMLLRTRLSALDTARQLQLMAERDETSVPVIGSVQAIDYGMSGPAIGDHLHGRSKDPGTPARYGVDVEAALRMRERLVEVSTSSTTREPGSTTREPVSTTREPTREELVTAS